MQEPAAPVPSPESVDAARAANLRYVTDQRPRIRRIRAGTGFRYVDPDGKAITDRATRDRIKALAIPPAWTEVWICLQPNGHLQATGRDARGRKQYRYHPKWRKVRDENKYGRLVAFGEALPKIRAAVEAALELPGLPREKVLATVVRLLETTFIRVGNEEYARANNSFGLTTLRNRHVDIRGRSIRFRFVGKGGKQHAITVSDRQLARLVKRLRDLPGQDLFQFRNEQGEPEPISSADVNDYLRTIAGEDFTAKDFRTWAGTLLAVRLLKGWDPSAVTDGGKSAIVATVKAVAADLGNTPAICRKCYIHPAVFEAFRNAEAFELWTEVGKKPARSGLNEEETALLRYLGAHQAAPPT